MGHWKVVVDDKGKWSVVTDAPPSPCLEDHKCYCGTGEPAEHLVGKNGCRRRMEDAPVATGDEVLAWNVNGVRITDYTLRDQRGYSQHTCGCWSSWNGSKTSLEFR